MSVSSPREEKKCLRGIAPRQTSIPNGLRRFYHSHEGDPVQHGFDCSEKRTISRPRLPLAAAALCGLIGLAGCGGSSDSNFSGSSAGLPTAKATQAQVAHGRAIFTTAPSSQPRHLHGIRLRGLPQSGQGRSEFPNLDGWLPCGPQSIFQIGPFATYVANLTPDAATGLGNTTDQQIYNALKHGAKAVLNAVPDSQGPPDFWASIYTPDKVRPYPLPTYPSASEQFAP